MEAFSIGYVLTSLIAGVLTVLSPCVLPTLPIVLSGSTASKSFWKPLRIILALMVSVIVFSILLKASTALLGVPSFVWRYLSGGILLVFGLFLLFPTLWAQISAKLGIEQSSRHLLNRSAIKNGVVGDFLVGASLGPVFTSCSPTYFVIISFLLDGNWSTGLIYLFTFVFGLALLLVLVALLGQKFVSRLKAVNNPNGWFKKGIALLFIVIGCFIVIGFDKRIEAFLLDRGVYDWLIQTEQRLPDTATDL